MAISRPEDKLYQEQTLDSACERLFNLRKVIVASNRGPVDYHIDSHGEPRARRGSGGLVTALNVLCQYDGLTWISSAIGDGDRHVGESVQWGHLPSPLPDHNLTLRFVAASRKVYHKYYNVICNPLIWFLQHYMWNTPYSPNIDQQVRDAWETGYIAMNRIFADAVINESKGVDPPPVVMLQDYHLYLAAQFIREARPNAIIQHFTHIPWPNTNYWALLPSDMRRAICSGLCSCDIVGLQSPRDVISFLQCCEAFLSEAQVDYNARTVLLNGHATLVRAYPVSVNVRGLRQLARSPRVQDYEERIRPRCANKTIVRVDRMEPSKNILRGFRAFDLLLEKYPEIKGDVVFFSFLVPSRTHIKQYQRYNQEVMNDIDRINKKYGDDYWQPIITFYENNYNQAIAGMRLYDVLLVNSVIDGMNLVAKEGPIVNTKNGVLILSEGTGAFQQLQEGALAIAPADLEGTVEAIYTALHMSEEEKRGRAEVLTNAIENYDADVWLERQLEDIFELA